MQSIHEQRAAKLYGGTTSPEPTKAPVPIRKTLYADSYGAPLGSYYGRLKAKLVDDAEKLAVVRDEEKKLEAFLKRKGVSQQDAQMVLGKLNDYDERREKQQRLGKIPKWLNDAQEKERVEKETLRRVETFDSLRVKHGGTSQAEAVVRRYNSVTAELRAEIPSLADRAALSGANLDVAVIETLHHYGTDSAAK